MKISEVYTVDPSTVVFDDKYVVFNPLHSEFEYEATRDNIKKLGQLDPILMLEGKCIDGRHRTRVALELSTHVRCVDIDPSLDEQSIILMCNKNVMSGRDYDNSQKAIQALELINRYKMTAVQAAKFMKVDRRLVSYAATIKGYGRQDILDTLMADKTSRVHLTSMERPSRSLELLAKFVKSENENAVVIIDDSNRVRWNPDAHIRTELGKAWYYELISRNEPVTLEVSMSLAELANYKFKIGESNV
jgi:hypothetical protein